MRGPRWHFQDELQALEADVQQMGTEAGRQLRAALAGVQGPADYDAIIAGDDEVDRRHVEVERAVLHLFALQTPVASDLRLLTALLHISLHLERVADTAVNIAKIARLVVGLPPNPIVQQQLDRMGVIALRMLDTVMQALARRDLELARRLPVMDQPVDELNRRMLDSLLAGADDRRMLGWAVPMYVVSREIERVGDHAVDIGEQVAFLVTGYFEEFTDAPADRSPPPGAG